MTTFFRLTPPPAEVPLNDSLAQLVALEDDYYMVGPSVGLRDRLIRWFQLAQVKDRIDIELQGVVEPARSRVKKLGNEAAEYLASVVEYDGEGMLQASSSGGALADRYAAQRAQTGYSAEEERSAKALSAGRKALADAVRLLREERLRAQAQAEEEDA